MDRKPTNDRANPVTKFCLAMEEHRRTPEGRVRTAKDFVAHFFPHDDSGANDRLFKLMPNEVRAPIVSAWGIRGTKAALRDDDVKIRTVVFDALVAGDIDEGVFEDGVNAQVLVDWIALSDWWKFWRKGKLTGVAIQRALATARELGLIDDTWFFDNVQGRGGKLKGTDVVCDTLSKDQVVAWLKKVHASGDGSPAGLVAAIGWDTILQKTAEDALLSALDAFAKRVGLVVEGEAQSVREPTSGSTETAAREAVVAKNSEAPPTRRPGSEPPPPVSEPIAAESPAPAAAAVASTEDGPNLAEARAQMLKMLDHPPAAIARTGREPSDAPGRPSSLEWPEPPSMSADAPTPPSSIDMIPVDEDEEAADAPPSPRAPVAAAAPAAPKANPKPPLPAPVRKVPIPGSR